ncbi:hypothetical protein [Limibacterium fermenti]|mgnify:FL=1|uniref:hypothetical protein n=1 Tax=Limibacterium fermenti TaxID=3229863 RepID=UPI000E921700|nr:hypothetical protein [Porphyromonadaceae bacterium]
MEDRNKIIADLFSRAKQDLHPDHNILILHIGEDFTFLINANGTDKAPQSWVLPIGSNVTSNKYFIHKPPTADEIEYAIIEVEDEIMALNPTIEKGKYRLMSFDPLVHDIAGYAGVTGNKLPIKEMESVFSRVAAIVSGRPASMDILPDSNEFAAGLLIVREVMHHLYFQEIILK